MLKSLRIQFPNRRTVQPLTTSLYNHAASPPPSIEFLDLSRCSITDSDIDALLIRFDKLKHLVLDHCLNLGDWRLMSEDLTWWSALGNRCALAGVKRAREREKSIKAWFEAQSSENRSVSDQHLTYRSRPGRRGLATATISLRASTPSPGDPTKNLQPWTKMGPLPKIHIIPSLPTLLSISTSPLMVSDDIPAFSMEIQVSMIVAFKNGWEDGLRVLRERRSRLATSFLRGTAVGPKARFLKFKDGKDRDEEEDGFEGLEDVEVGDEGAFLEAVDGDGTPISREPPILCFSGLRSKDEGHIDGCGHSIASGIWIEEF